MILIMAADYIRRDDALYAIQRQRGATRSPAQNRLLDLLRVDIVRAPAADVAEVVRCKGCKHWQRHTGVVDSPNGHCFYLETCTNGNDFCSYGEYQTNSGGAAHE